MGSGFMMRVENGMGILVSGLWNNYNSRRELNQLNHLYKAHCAESTYEMHGTVFDIYGIPQFYRGHVSMDGRPTVKRYPQLRLVFPVSAVLIKGALLFFEHVKNDFQYNVSTDYNLWCWFLMSFYQLFENIMSTFWFLTWLACVIMIQQLKWVDTYYHEPSVTWESNTQLVTWWFINR